MRVLLSKLLYKLLIFILFIFCSFSSFAEKLSVGFGSTLAPWVMAGTDNGILIDIFTEAMAPLGYDIEKYYYPYARRIDSYKAQHVDVVSDVNLANIKQLELAGYYSGVVYAYENYAFTLKKRQLAFTNIAELSDYTLISWQGAREVMGPEYKAMADSSVGYREIHNQKLQVKMLLKERVDVIQMDEQIFEFYLANLISEDPAYRDKAVTRFPLFGKNESGFMFHSKKIRDDFVQQISLMRADGRLDKIFSKYTKQSKPPVLNNK